MTDKRLVGFAFMSSGAIVSAMYGLLLVVATLLDEAHPLAQFRGLLYGAGVLVVPIVLTLFVAGGSFLLDRRPPGDGP
jgi:hypothetical protein